jgi:L-threonylcarbamoyladenylate synthase
MKLEDLKNISKEDLTGKVICFPTDTVYGVGAVLDDEVAIEKIYEIKHRDYAKPLAILAGSIDEVLKYVETPSEEVMNWMRSYWPGALTIVFKKKPCVSDKIVAGKETIGFRIPNSSVALTILNKYGALATTSINLSGSVALNTYEEIKQNFGNQIDYLIDEKVASSNLSSTVVDVSSGTPKILRQGGVHLQ